jgi:poly(glycerol-phosphate) alpha-glucosyltransferase
MACRSSGPAAFGYSPDLLPALEAAGLDLVHLHGIWMYSSLACARWAGRSGRPSIVSAHGMLDPWALRNSTWKKRLAGLLFERRNLRRAACLHALNQAEADAIRGYGLKNPICVVPNGVALPGPAEVAPPDWTALLPAHSKVLLFLGRLHPKKGLSEMLRAWATCNRGLRDEWRLVIAGWDQGYRRQLEVLCSELEISDTVLFIGPQFGPDKTAAYRAAHGFILPSFSEGLPMAVLEAWAHGLPVLCTAQCNLPEGFAAGAGIRIDPNSGSIASGMERLFASETERRDMGIRGRALVEQSFTWPQIAGQMSAVYHWLLGRAARPDCVQN